MEKDYRQIVDVENGAGAMVHSSTAVVGTDITNIQRNWYYISFF